MLERLFEKMWGTFSSREELLKFIRLAAIFAFTIGVFWIINPTKDVVFLHTVGLKYLWCAKIFSLCTMIPLIMAYSRVVDAFPRHKIFYVLCVFYGCGALLFSYFIMDPVWGVSNPNIGFWRPVGWLWYAFVESFGSLMVALFWSFAADTSTPESAKRGFSIIALGAQVGGVSFPLLLHGKAKIWGPGPFVVIGGLGIFCIALAIAYFMHVTPQKELKGYFTKKETAAYKKPKTGFFEGLKLIFSNAYLRGIVGVVALYEVVATVIEFHMKTQAKLAYSDINDLNGFFFKYAVCTNGVALLCLLFGAGAIGRRIGLLKTLLLLPLLVFGGIVAIALNPTLSTTLIVFVLTRGLNYALNQPAKEQLYIPTSRETKYKAKAWIDMFGSRMAKGTGSSVHMLRPVLQSNFVGVSSLICFGLVGIWMGAAWYTGIMHAEAVDQDRIIC